MKDISMRKTAGYGRDLSNTYDLIIKNDTDFTCDLYIGKYGSKYKKVSLGPGKSDISKINDGLVKEISASNNNNKSKSLSAEDLSNLAKWEGSSYNLYVSDLLGEAQSTGGARTSAPSGVEVTLQRGVGQGSSGQGASQPAEKIKLIHQANTVLEDQDYTYVVTSSTGFNFKNRKTSQAGSMNSSHRDWNAAATALNKLKPSEKTTDAAAPTATGASTQTAPAATSAPAEATPAPAPAAAEIDPVKVKAGLVILLKLVAGDSLKIMPGGIRAETKVWKGVIDGFDGPDKLANRIITDAAFAREEERKLAFFKPETLRNANEMKNPDLLSALGKINNIIYNIKNKSKRRFLNIDLRGERQIAESVKKSLSSASSLHELHTLSKVAARRERAKKSLDSAIEKEASVEDDMTSKVENRRAAARAKLGL